MVRAAAVRQDGLMATFVTEREPSQLRMPSATSMAWQRKLATAFKEAARQGQEVDDTGSRLAHPAIE
jgi:hypothetical protein